MAGAGGRFGVRFERAILLVHRWLGILVCLLLLMWFVSGIVLAYVRFPAMGPDEKLNVLPAIDQARVAVAPGDALKASGLAAFPRDFRLETSGDRPVYRLKGWEGERITIDATTGEKLGPISGEMALAIVKAQYNLPDAQLEARDLQRDQWTVTGYWDEDRPFHLIRMNDSVGRKYYVAIDTGEIVLDTTEKERFWNWLGAIPHWMYFEFVRSDVSRWQWTIYILAGAGIFVSISGMWIGVKRIRVQVRKRYANGASTPFRGWLKWHHLIGVIGGVFLCLWIISGFLTMYPGGFLEGRSLNREQQENFAGAAAPQWPEQSLGALELSRDVRRISFRYLDGRAIAVTENKAAAPVIYDVAKRAVWRPALADYRHMARKIEPGATMIGLDWVTKGDEWWHTAFQRRELPIVRARFDNGLWFHINPETGRIVGMLDGTGRVNRWSIVAIHDIDWYWLLERRPLWDIVLYLTLLPGIAISVSGLWIGWRRLQRTQEGFRQRYAAAGAIAGRFDAGYAAHDIGARQVVAHAGEIRVIHASQTGSAQEMADRTVEALKNAGLPATATALATLDPAAVSGDEVLLFIVSTTGEGDPPDTCVRFRRKVMMRSSRLAPFAYAVLALGDRDYPKFCAFGAEVDQWLERSGAKRLFAMTCLDRSRSEDDAVAVWSTSLAATLDRPVHVERSAPFGQWEISRRECLNPGSQGAPAFHIELTPLDGLLEWRAGDVATIAAGLTWTEFENGEGAFRLRDYSIASIPNDGRIDLLVRQTRGADGGLGLGSGLLTTAPLGAIVPLRVRTNASFHAPDDDRPLILIGNGTGIAGLRAILRQRAAEHHCRNWLIFGERNVATDSFYAQEICQLQHKRVLEAVDCVFSRDQEARQYVQDRIRERAGRLRDWVADGASIYVCGSLEGMAPGVHDALVSVLGAARMDELTLAGGYRRDVY